MECAALKIKKCSHISEKKTLILDMQIQICAEYQGMLPRLRLVCQVFLTNAAEAWVACPVILHRS